MAKVFKKQYKCNSCDAVDTVKLFPHETPPVAVNCLKCGSGQKHNLTQQMQVRTGMWPVENE